MKGSSLQSKIAGAMWLMTILSTLTAAILSASLLIQGHRESIRQQLQAVGTSLISLGITNFSELNDFEQFDAFIEEKLQIEKVGKVIRIFDKSGKLIYSTIAFDYDHFPNQIALTEKPSFLTLKGQHRKYESLIIPYQAKKHKRFYLQIIIPLPRYRQILETFWWQSLLLLCALIGFALALSRMLAIRLIKPVRTIAGHLEKMDPQHAENWRPLSGIEKGQYLSEITDGINLLMIKTRTALFQLRKMSRYVAHELRTPLTVLQGEAETTLFKSNASKEEYENVLCSSLEEINRMSEIITTVLQVGDPNHHHTKVQSASLNLTSWLLENKLSWEKILGKSLQIEIEKKEPVFVFVDTKLFYRLIDNLVRNIQRHTPSETSCHMELKKTGRTCLVISDNGPGMSHEKLHSLNHEKSLSEVTGVGLHFCFRIAELCGLKLSFSNRPEGGLKIEIAF